MTPEQEVKAKRLIDRQIQLSNATLAALLRVGLTDERPVQLDFFFNARDEASARALIAHLAENDCLDLKLERSGSFLSRKFGVSGKSQPTVVTPEILAQWIPWMVVKGITRNCDFDGWGAEV